MKQTLGIVRYNFFGFFRNPKVIFILFLEFVLSFLLTGRIMVVMDNYNTPVQAIEPFLWTFGDGTAVLLSSMLLLLLFSDLPKMTPVTPYQLIRTTKKKWLLGQFVYITFVTILYTCFMLLFTSVLCMKDSYPGNLWSDTAAMLRQSIQIKILLNTAVPFPAVVSRLWTIPGIIFHQCPVFPVKLLQYSPEKIIRSISRSPRQEFCAANLALR